jgi:hypothetical protein
LSKLDLLVATYVVVFTVYKEFEEDDEELSVA